MNISPTNNFNSIFYYNTFVYKYQNSDQCRKAETKTITKANHLKKWRGMHRINNTTENSPIRTKKRCKLQRAYHTFAIFVGILQRTR